MHDITITYTEGMYMMMGHVFKLICNLHCPPYSFSTKKINIEADVVHRPHYVFKDRSRHRMKHELIKPECLIGLNYT